MPDLHRLHGKLAVLSGAAGFIGSHLADRLLAAGCSVIGLDNLITGSENNLRHLIGNSSFRWLRHDVTQPLDLETPVDFVLHLASPASPRDYQAHPIETLDAGSLGTRRLLELASRHNARFLLASTSECYGDPAVHPQVETYWGNVNPVGPRSCYDEAKRFAEALTTAWGGSRSLSTGIARIFNTYGPRMKPNDGRVVPEFVGAALAGQPIPMFGDGSQTRSFCYVSDLVEGLCRLLVSDETTPVNLGNPQEIAIADFAAIIQEMTGSRTDFAYLPLPDEDPVQRRPDISKAQRVLGWSPAVSLEDGLRETVDWFRQLLVIGHPT